MSDLDIGCGRIRFESGDAPDRLEGFVAGPGRFYEEFYGSGAAALEGLRRYQIRLLMATLDLAPGQRLTMLDVGAGNGIAVDEVNARFGPTVSAFGIEPSLKAAKPPVFKGRLADVGRVEGLPARFNIVSFLDVLEHFEEPAAVLRSVRSLLEPGGRLLVKVPNREATIYRLAKALRWRSILRRLYQVQFPPPHFYYFDRASLVALLRREGFAPEKVGYLSEVPLTHLWERLWGLGFFKRVVGFCGFLGLKVASSGRRAECLYVLARLPEGR